MSTTVISVSINKGGSGKTSILANLSYALSELDYKVLIIDTDAQMNLTKSFNMESDVDNSFFRAFTQRESIENYIKPTGYKNIDIVISAYELAGIEAQMVSMPLREYIVREIIEEVKSNNKYDFILFDTNPSLGMLNTSVLYASDGIIIPVEPTAFGLEGLDVFIGHFEAIKNYHEELKIFGVVLNKIDRRRTKRDEVVKVIEEVFGKYVLDTSIAIDSNIENAQWSNMPLVPYLKETNRQSNNTKAFIELAKEVVSKCQM